MIFYDMNNLRAMAIIMYVVEENKSYTYLKMALKLFFFGLKILDCL